MARNCCAIGIIWPFQIWMSNIKFHLIRFICSAHRADWAPAIPDTYQVLLVQDRRTRMSPSQRCPRALFDSVGSGTFPFIKQVKWDNKIWKLQAQALSQRAGRSRHSPKEGNQHEFCMSLRRRQTGQRQPGQMSPSQSHSKNQSQS